MLCKFNIQVGAAIHIVQLLQQKVFHGQFVVYNFRGSVDCSSARLHYLMVDLLETGPDVSNYVVNGCIFLNHLNKYGIFLLGLDA